MTTTARPTPRKNTKQVAVADMLRRPQGATMAELVAATGWKPGSIRGALAGALKTRLGLTVASGIEDGRGRVYRIAGPGPRDG